VNYQQLPVNAPIVPVNNFQRDGAMTFVSQGSAHNYQSTIKPLSYQGKRGNLEHNARDTERFAKHEAFVGGAFRDLSEITELDFEQPRALWSKVWNDQQREAYVQNVAGHFGNVKSPEVKARQLSVWAAVDQGLSDRIAKAVGHKSVAPLKVAPASAANVYRANLGYASFTYASLLPAVRVEPVAQEAETPVAAVPVAPPKL
jgi:catalase